MPEHLPFGLCATIGGTLCTVIAYLEYDRKTLRAQVLEMASRQATATERTTNVLEKLSERLGHAAP